jgi:MerR family transcriptional regulator, light-induced transcriptional regulator
VTDLNELRKTGRLTGQRDDNWLRHDRVEDAANASRLTGPRAVSAERIETLFRTIETEIIPRLMLLHREGSGEALPAPDATLVIEESHVVEFTDLALKGDAAAGGYLEALMLRGAPLDAIYLNLLAPAARRLGDLWNADLCEFTDVTVALGRMQALLRGLSADMKLPRSSNCSGRRVLFVPAPGEQHTFGLAMVCDFFRAGGWDVWTEAPAPADTVVALVQERWFDVVGFSMGHDRGIAPTVELIRSIRKASHNRAVKVLVGGPLIIDRPQIATLVDADGMATDAAQAMLVAEEMVGARPAV